MRQKWREKPPKNRKSLEGQVSLGVRGNARERSGNLPNLPKFYHYGHKKLAQIEGEKAELAVDLGEMEGRRGFSTGSKRG